MKIATLIVIILLALKVPAQPTKKITVHNNSMVYDVLISDTTIRHGNYKELACDSSILVNGYYKFGLKDSIWDENMGRGNYLNDKRTGTWEFRDFYGEVYQKYNYTSKELLYTNNVKSAKYKFVHGNDTLKTRLDRPPLPIGYLTQWFQISRQTGLHFPVDMSGIKRPAKVYITFWVDTIGGASDFKVVRGFSGPIDSAALDLAQRFTEWAPGMLKNKAVAARNLMLVEYKLKKTKIDKNEFLTGQLLVIINHICRLELYRPYPQPSL